MDNIEVRPCIIRVNEDATIKGLFYRWVYSLRNEIVGLVEIEGGNVVYAPPISIQFIDSEYYFNQFDWRVVEPVEMEQVQEDVDVIPEGMYNVEDVDIDDEEIKGDNDD